MAITLQPETKTQLLDSIKRYVAENLDQDIGDLKAGLLLDYVLQEIAPSVYNQAIQDAQRYFQERATDLVILFAIVALLLLGPRRGGRPQGPFAILAGILFLVWLAAAFGLGSLWNAVVGPIAQP